MSSSSHSSDASEDSDTGLSVTKYWSGGAGDSICESRYSIVKMLGDGRLATVYEAFDTKTSTPCAVKVYRYGSDNKRWFANEYSINMVLNKSQTPSDNIIKYLGVGVHLELSGPIDGVPVIHPCVVYQLYGENLFDFMQSLGTGLSVPIVRKFSKNILNGLHYLHSNGIVHADIKANNILLRVPSSQITDPSQLSVVIADIGASTIEDNLFELKVGTAEYISPECIWEVGYDRATDIWSFGCLFYEMITGDYLFDLDEYNPHDYITKPKSRYTTDGHESPDDDDYDEEYELAYSHLVMIESLIGSPPASLVSYGRRYYNKSGHLKGRPRIKKTSLRERLTTSYSDISSDDAGGISDVVRACIKWDPHTRPSAEELLSHKFINC